MWQVGDAVPAATVYEYNAVAGEGCPIGPAAVDLAAASQGKTIALFALPGAYTPTCSAKHLPGYVELATEFRAAGVDEIWCLSVNDAFVMHHWGQAQGATGVVRMLGDGSAIFTQAVGLVLDLTAKGMGVRSQRYAALLVDGRVAVLQVEAPGQFDVSSASALLAAARARTA
ncbi:MAG: peroxiredoxin [Inhella sp.]|uniref:peroxiredoxin n=1 Tax=Inhella sp. TaxID=1921806 RepID=UPI0022C6DCDD|nr:peroxiredoxin [Inhella sp.]MCZ8233945.1 peroxiredoxin [Inhella sp.]